MLDGFAKVSRIASRLSLYLSAAGLIGMTIIIGWQVFARYVLNAAPAWTEQAALFLMLWFILFAAAVGVRERFHIRLTLVQDMLPARQSYLLRTFCHLIVLVFGVFMAWSGFQLIALTWEHVIPTLGLPRGLAYVPIAGAGILIAFFSLEHILTEARGDEVKPLWN
ncbi:TRAP transporter small permease [Parvularcula sp. LCG005]|uniref:TRAP transporter small permease n=1 Tax=Parvularcula sp. LCG005 TaxID=3078805 RepID=UPI002943E314|nr:TRAP transporter small permease [Parvularcula sp. LCG005]WOI53474.1 TRAP transporter small permease [Parvularcula sp. LCG005]